MNQQSANFLCPKQGTVSNSQRQQAWVTFGSIRRFKYKGKVTPRKVKQAVLCLLHAQRNLKHENNLTGQRVQYTLMDKTICPEHLQWDQNLKIATLNETRSIPVPLTWESSPRVATEQCPCFANNIS